MKVSALISAAIHLIIMILMYTGLPLFRDPEVLEQPRVIQVDIVEIADITNLPKAKPIPEEKPKEKEPEPEKPKPAPKPKPEPKAEPPKPEPKPEPEPAPKPEPSPEPEPEPIPEPEPETKPEPSPEPKPEVAKVEDVPVPKPRPKPRSKVANVKPEPKPKKEPEKKPEKKFDLSQISALLDKKKREQTSRKADETDTKKSQSAEKVTSSSSAGADASLPMSISERDAFRQQVERCWNPPTGSVNAEELIATVRISLNRDGTVKGQPEIVRSGAFRSRFEKIAAESAVRAVLQCQPYKLPAEKYERWRDTVLKFDPREMFGQ